MKNEKDLILSDTLISAVLQIEADAIGVSIEEYVNKFLDAFYKEPEKFNSILKTKKRREQV